MYVDFELWPAVFQKNAFKCPLSHNEMAVVYFLLFFFLYYVYSSHLCYAKFFKMMND